MVTQPTLSHLWVDAVALTQEECGNTVRSSVTVKEI